MHPEVEFSYYDGHPDGVLDGDFGALIVDISDGPPGVRYRKTTAAGTLTGWVEDAGGATTFDALTDKASVNLPSVNTPLANALAAKAADNAVVKLTGDQTVGGVKNFSSSPTVPTTLTSDSSTKAASTAFVQALVAAALAGLAENKGALNCSANPNFPAASNGDFWRVSHAGRIGGASGTIVEVGDVVMAVADNGGGTLASVGTSWLVMQANIAGITAAGLAILQAANAAEQRTALGATTIGSALFTAANPSAVRFIRINADNSLDFLSASAMLTALGGGSGGNASFFASNSITKLTAAVYNYSGWTSGPSGNIGTTPLAVTVDGVVVGSFVASSSELTPIEEVSEFAAWLNANTVLTATYGGAGDSALTITHSLLGSDHSFSFPNLGWGISASEIGGGAREVIVQAGVSGKRPLFSPLAPLVRKSSGDDWTSDLQLCYKVSSTYTPIWTIEAVYLTGDGANSTLPALNVVIHDGALEQAPVGAAIVLRTVSGGSPADETTGTGFTIAIQGMHY